MSRESVEMAEKKIVLTVRVPAAVSEQLAVIGAEMDRSMSYVAALAIKEYLARELPGLELRKKQGLA